MDNILNYPTSTHVDRLVPKTAFYKHLEINTRLKMRFVEDVERIQWLYKLAPSTMNVDTGKTVHEIVMFLVMCFLPSTARCLAMWCLCCNMPTVADCCSTTRNG